MLGRVTHDNTVGVRLCDQREKSALLVVQAWSLTIECLVYLFVPSTSTSRQFVSILLTIIQLIKILFLEMVIMQAGI